MFWYLYKTSIRVIYIYIKIGIFIPSQLCMYDKPSFLEKALQVFLHTWWTSLTFIFRSSCRHGLYCHCLMCSQRTGNAGVVLRRTRKCLYSAKCLEILNSLQWVHNNLNPTGRAIMGKYLRTVRFYVAWCTLLTLTND